MFQYCDKLNLHKFTVPFLCILCVVRMDGAVAPTAGRRGAVPYTRIFEIVSRRGWRPRQPVTKRRPLRMPPLLGEVAAKPTEGFGFAAHKPLSHTACDSSPIRGAFFGGWIYYYSAFLIIPLYNISPRCPSRMMLSYGRRTRPL